MVIANVKKYLCFIPDVGTVCAQLIDAGKFLQVARFAFFFVKKVGYCMFLSGQRTIFVCTESGKQRKCP